jgi:transcriptional regulator with XRE-family HTH domain
MTIADDRRRELGLFLRSRRERLSPELVGIKTLGARRTTGLRREEVAVRAGMSVTWYTWMEQARKINVSRQILASLADALGLSTVETTYMFNLAGELPLVDLRMTSVSDQQLRFMEHVGAIPAFVTNQRFDVLAWNRAFSALFPFFDALTSLEQNSLAMIFREGAHEFYPDWDAEAAQTVALFRAHAGDRLVEPEFCELIDRLTAQDQRFADLWSRRDLVSLAPSRRRFMHPRLGLVEMEYLKFYSGDEGTTLVVHQPAPGTELAVALAELAAEYGDGEEIMTRQNDVVPGLGG